MRRSRMVACVVSALLTFVGSALAKDAVVKETEPLTAAGHKLEAKYAAELEALKKELTKSIPAIDEKKMATFQKACEAEKAAEAERNATQAALNKGRSCHGVLNHRNKWVAEAKAGIAAIKEKIKQAEAMENKEEAEKILKTEKENLAKVEKGLETALSEHKKATDAVEKWKIDEPKHTKALEDAKAALTKAQAATTKALEDLKVQSFLENDKWDAQLAKVAIMSHATPRGLAEFALQGKKQEKLIENLLSDDDLLVQMAFADGAKDGKYGQAMEIYTAIRKASKKAENGMFQRLAAAVSLVHAVPIGQSNPRAQTDAPKTVDPVKRYLHYEKAFLDGELDPAFKDLTTWDYCYVVFGNEPDETLAWGREMLRNYRPDIISTPDYRWRYAKSVKTDVKYTKAYRRQNPDKPELQFFQNILRVGGVCGRRAFFGRFILRAFGIPNTARPQPGHAALAHWTPDGWVICFGAGWGHGHTRTIYGKDLDFLATTQARALGDTFRQVKRAQWVGTVLGEEPVYGLLSGTPGLWYGLSLYRQRSIIEEAKATALAAVGTDIGEANESKVKEEVETAKLADEDRTIEIARDGTITVPAAACSRPTDNTAKILFMPSNLGGKQLHYGRLSAPETFEYTLDAPKAGKYAISARVVTVSDNQNLLITVNGAGEPVTLGLPYTLGSWETTGTAEIQLKKGKNVLTFSRGGGDVRGVTIKDFTLKPVR